MDNLPVFPRFPVVVELVELPGLRVEVGEVAVQDGVGVNISCTVELIEV